MLLQFERSQSAATFRLVPLRVGGGVMFTLWAKTELSQEEQHLVQQYNFENALLVLDDPIEAIKKAFRSALVFSVPIWVLLFFLFDWYVTTTLTLIALIVITVLYYNELREHIYVRDLLNGRKFRCYSIIELVKKEAYLRHICAYLRQVLEAARHWDGRESIEIEPLSAEDAKQAVIAS